MDLDDLARVEVEQALRAEVVDVALHRGVDVAQRAPDAIAHPDVDLHVVDVEPADLEQRALLAPVLELLDHLEDAFGRIEFVRRRGPFVGGHRRDQVLADRIEQEP